MGESVDRGVERKRLTQIDRSLVWTPQPGPQLAAMLSKADQLLFGGSAGGGKTNLAIGLALTQHRRSLFIRREGIQLQAVIDEIETMVGSRDGYNGQTNTWRLPGNRVIQFGGVPNLGDEAKFQGNPRDLLALDEAANLLEEQARFLLGWVRTTVKGQRCRALLATNPPMSGEGEWIIRWFAPWLDPTFAKPAVPGELRWFTSLDGQDVWVDGPEPFAHKGELVTPMSRTFVPSKVADNRYLRGSGYVAQLQALPEPMRSRMLHGDFTAGREDKPYQIVPTEWVRAAQERWKKRPKPSTPMTTLGVDVARGGADKTVLTPRYGNWFGKAIKVPGKSTPDGPAVAALVLQHRRDNAKVHVDVIGVGSSVYDTLRPKLGTRVVPLNASHASKAMDKSGQLSFVNSRAEWWWRMREALDPTSGEDIALPPDPELIADLCLPQWKLMARGIQVESKEDLQKRAGRSPDVGDSAVYALAEGIRALSWDGINQDEPVLPRRI